MKLYSENKYYKLYQGSMLDMQEVIKPESIDSIVTDPPYELNFMNKGWDNSGIAFQSNAWKQCYDVLKPGGYLLAFGGSRTYHRIACAIEDAGFEIRDTIMWLYGSGFPKSMNIGLAIDKKNGVESKIVGQNQNILKKQAKDLREGYRKIVDSYNAGAIERNNGFKNVSADIKEAQNEWNGWGTALKPSFEPIIVARKPFKGSYVDNVIEYGVGGINIGECRVGSEVITQLQKDLKPYTNNKMGVGYHTKMTGITTQTIGRFPANTILTYDNTDFDEVCGGFPKDKGYKPHKVYSNIEKYEGYGDSGSASRYFYCAKASKKDRDEGLDDFEEKLPACITDFRPTLATSPEKWNNGNPVDYAMMRTTPKKNIHPTVKPTELMQYLIRLVSPDGATILDCFNGSGSTGKAVMYENKERNKNYKYIGIELTEEYLPISKARIEYVINNDLKVEKENKEIKEGQTTIFDFIEKEL